MNVVPQSQPSEPDWQIHIIDGEPVKVINAAAIRKLTHQSPLGYEEGKRRLIEQGIVPAWIFEEES